MWGYKSIDVPIQNEAQRFEFSMLKLARILAKRVEERRDFSAAKVSKYLNKYSNILRPYSTKEIREKLSNLNGEFRGGGFQVVWFETPQPHQRNQPPHFSIEFSRVYGFAGTEEECHP
jgi:hypothetical protein